MRLSRAPLMISDRRTDGDSLGAALSLAHWFDAQGVSPRVHVSDELPPQLALLPGSDWCFSGNIDAPADLVLVCDCSEESYVEEVLRLLPGVRPVVINIDHHDTNPLYGDVALVVPEAPATSELVFRCIHEMQREMPANMALCLMVGLGFDTTFFRNGATNERAFFMASELLSGGVRLTDVMRVVYGHRTAKVLRLWGVALQRLRQHPDLGIVSTCLTQKDFMSLGLDEATIDGLSDFLGLALRLPALAVFRETKEGNVKVSLRARKGNVSRLAQAFGGGGHEKAAGFTLFQKKLIEQADGSWQTVTPS